MKPAEPEIPARYYTRMVELLQRRGLDVGLLLRNAGISEPQLQAADARLRLAQVEALVAEAIRLSDAPDLGFDVGRVIKVSSHSMVGYAMLTSPSLDYALNLVARYFRLLLPSFQMRYRRDALLAEMQFLPALELSPACRLFHYEAIAAACHGEANELLPGGLPEYDLYLGYPPPVHAGRYAELRGARCHFVGAQQEGLRVTFPAALAAQPLALADQAALGVAEARCREQVQEVLAGRRVAGWVSGLLHEAQDHAPTLVELARTLNVAPRTLDRYLRLEGQTFRALQQAAQVERATALLREGRLAITQIALQLGYRDAANFSRAFRKATGASPSTYARAQRDAGGAAV